MGHIGQLQFKKKAIILAEIIVKRYFIIAYYLFGKLNELKVKQQQQQRAAFKIISLSSQLK